MHLQKFCLTFVVHFNAVDIYCIINFHLKAAAAAAAFFTATNRRCSLWP